MDGLIIPESMCNPSCYAVLQGAKKPIFYSHGQAQHAVNMELFLYS